MKKTTTLIPPLVAVAAAVMLLTGCGSSEPAPSASPSTSPSSTPEAPTTPSPSAGEEFDPNAVEFVPIPEGETSVTLRDGSVFACEPDPDFGEATAVAVTYDFDADGNVVGVLQAGCEYDSSDGELDDFLDDIEEQG